MRMVYNTKWLWKSGLPCHTTEHPITHLWGRSHSGWRCWAWFPHTAHGAHPPSRPALSSARNLDNIKVRGQMMRWYGTRSAMSFYLRKKFLLLLKTIHIYNIKQWNGGYCKGWFQQDVLWCNCLIKNRPQTYYLATNNCRLIAVIRFDSRSALIIWVDIPPL